MANSKFWFYPSKLTGSPLVEVDLGEEISDVQDDPWADVSDARGYDGSLQRQVLATGLVVRIVLERFGNPSNAAVERAVRSMEAHLAGGGAVAFARDAAKSYATSRSGTIPTGSTEYVGDAGNSWDVFASGALADGDEVVIESMPPAVEREYTTASGATAGDDNTVSITNGTRYDYIGPSICRYRWFYPLLVLPEDQLGKTIVTHDHRRVFTLDATFLYLPVAAYAAMNPAGLINLDNKQPAVPLGAGVLSGANGDGSATLDAAAGRQAANPLGGHGLGW